MAALAFILAGVAVIFAVVLLLRDRRRRQEIPTLVRERDNALAGKPARTAAFGLPGRSGPTREPG